MSNHREDLLFSLKLGISEQVTQTTIIFYKIKQGNFFL